MRTRALLSGLIGCEEQHRGPREKSTRWHPLKQKGHRCHLRLSKGSAAVVAIGKPNHVTHNEPNNAPIVEPNNVANTPTDVQRETNLEDFIDRMFYIGTPKFLRNRLIPCIKSILATRSTRAPGGRVSVSQFFNGAFKAVQVAQLT